MQTSKISLMSFRSQGDQREHSDMADRYLFSSDRIELRFNTIFNPNSKKKNEQKKENDTVLTFVQISISNLSVNYLWYFKNNTIKTWYLNLKQRHYKDYLRLNNTRAD